MLTEEDRTRLDTWWAEWFNRASHPATPAAMRLWYETLTPDERAYIDGKIAAMQEAISTLAQQVTAWMEQATATIQPAVAQLNQSLTAWWRRVYAPTPPDRSAWAVHKPRTRRYP